MKAVTIKLISGCCIQDIPAGTRFEVVSVGRDYATCEGLSVTSVWNDEYRFVEDDEEEDDET